MEEDDDEPQSDSESSQCSASEDDEHKDPYKPRNIPNDITQNEACPGSQPIGRQSDRLDQLSDMVGVLATYLCTEHFTQESPASSLLVYFSAILGFTPRGTTFL